MLKNVTKKAKLSLFLTGLVFACVFGALIFVDQKSTDAAGPIEYVVNSTGYVETGSCDATCNFIDAITASQNDGVDSLITFDLSYPATIDWADAGAVHLLESNSNLEIRGPGAENLIFDGSVNPGAFIEVFPNNNNSIISGITIQNFPNSAIRTYNTGTLTVTDNIFNNNKGGIGSTDLGEKTFTNNTIIGGEGGIGGNASGDNINISNNTFTNIDYSAIELNITDNSVTNIDINSNGISGNGDGILIFSEIDGAVITDLQINNNVMALVGEEFYGIALYREVAGNYLVINSLIDNNQIVGGGENIVVSSLGDGISDLIISNNNLSEGTDNNGSIMLAYIQNGGVVVDSNYITNSEILGIFVVNSEGSFTITNNTITQNNQGGIQITSTENTFPDNTIISNNTINNNAQYGIFIEGSTNATLSLTNNEINDNGEDGIFIKGDIAVTSSENTFLNNDEAGVNTADNVTGVFTDETFVDNKFGYTISGGTLQIIDSTISSSADYDIALNSPGETMYLDNTSFLTYAIADGGEFDVNYDTRVHLVDDNENDLEGAMITASCNPLYNLGITGTDGLTSYTSLDAAIITGSNIDTGDGMTENSYTFTATKDDVSAEVIKTVNLVNQQVEINLVDDIITPKYDITGYVKKDETGVENAELHIYDSEDDLLSILQTNSEGYYRSSDLEEGVYEIIIQPASLADLTGYTLLETNPRLVSLSGVDAEVDFNYSSIPVVNKNTNENVNGNSNKPYVNYNYNTNTNSNTNTNVNVNVNVNENGNININLNDNSNENQNINRQISLVNANINLNTNSSVEEPIIEQKIDQDFVLEGTAKPNTKIIITLELENGETLSIETITDSQGNWQVVFDKDKLLAGDHTIYIQTELNGQLSEMVELAKLVISGDKKISTTWLVVVTISVLFIIIIIILILLYVKKRNKKDQI